MPTRFSRSTTVDKFPYIGYNIDKIKERRSVELSERSDFFTTVRQEAHVDFEEKKSIFIGHAIRTDTEEEAQAFIKQLKKE